MFVSRSSTVKLLRIFWQRIVECVNSLNLFNTSSQRDSAEKDLRKALEIVSVEKGESSSKSQYWLNGFDEEFHNEENFRHLVAQTKPPFGPRTDYGRYETSRERADSATVKQVIEHKLEPCDHPLV